MAELTIARLSGVCADGFERGSGTVTHALRESPEELKQSGFRKALCGATPGRRSAHGFYPVEGETTATCARCAARALKEET